MKQIQKFSLFLEKLLSDLFDLFFYLLRLKIFIQVKFHQKIMIRGYGKIKSERTHRKFQTVEQK